MTIEDNKAVVRRYMQAVVDGDVETIKAVQHPDVKWWVLGVGNVDRDTFIEQTCQGLVAADKRTINITSMTAEEDRVAITAEGEMVFPDKVYRNSYHNLLTIRDGLIVEGREYMDPRAATEAFGSA